MHIRLTESGRKFLEENWDIMMENLSAKLDRSLTEEEMTALCEAASTMIELLEKVN